MLVLLTVVSSFIAACVPEPFPEGFHANNLLGIDPRDAHTASMDLLAVFSYRTEDAIHFRIDFLDIGRDQQPGLTVLIDSFPGSRVKVPDAFEFEDQWEVILRIQPDQAPQINTGMDVAIDPTQISVLYDPGLDFITLRAPIELVDPPGPFEIALVSHAPGDDQPVDVLGPIRSDSPTPMPLPILFVFWDVFPSATPAQAMRSWDGAHNGPAGERFGLRHLLKAVQTHPIPIVLSDLDQPGSLEGLYLLGAQAWIKALESQGLLMRSAFLPASLCQEAARMRWPTWLATFLPEYEKGSGSPSSKVMTCVDDEAPSLAYLLVAGFPSYSFRIADNRTDPFQTRFTHQEPRVIPLPAGDLSESLGYDGGPSLALRQEWARALNDKAEDEVFLINANFQNSFWGDPHSAMDTFHWIENHPWLQPISLDTYLRGFQTSTISHDSIVDIQGKALHPFGDNINYDQDLLFGSSSDMLTRLIRHVLLESSFLTNCPGSMTNCDSREAFFKEAIALLSITRNWEESIRNHPGEPPQEASYLSFNTEHLWDIHATGHWLVVLGETSSTVQALFTYDPLAGVIPIIWQPFMERGGLIDPSQQISVTHMSENSLKLEFGPDILEGTVLLPLYLPLDLFLQDDTSLAWSTPQNPLTIPYSPNVVLEFESIAEMHNLISVFDSPSSWDQVEDPNQEMPPGHYLPFPYAILILDYPSEVSIVLKQIGNISDAH